MDIEFEGHYERSQIFKGIALANQLSPKQNFLRIGFSIAVFVIFILIFIAAAAKSSYTPFDLLKSARHLIALPLLLYFLLRPYISSYFGAQRLWNNLAMEHPNNGTISNRGITYDSKIRGSEEISWEQFSKLRITDDLIVLLTDGGTLVLFPKTFFKTETDWTAVAKLAEFKVVEAK